MATDEGAFGSVVVSTFDGAASLTLAAGPTRFSVLPEIGMIGSSLTHQGQEYLDFQGGVTAALGGHTTGLPLLSPWANRLSSSKYRVGSHSIDLEGVKVHRDGNGLPIHGLMVGRSGWEMMSVKTQVGSASMVASFDHASDEMLMAAFPFPHELLVSFTVTPGRLMVSTTLIATGRRAVPVSFGWHPYFRLPGVGRERLRLAMPVRQRLLLDARGIPTGEEVHEAASITRLADDELDDAYRLGRDRQLLIASGRRRLAVVFDRHYPFAQIYSPTGSDFVALEPMTAPTDALVRGTTPMVAPGERFTARFAVSLS